MTAPTEYGKTDAPARMPRWLALVLFTAATLVAIGALWSLAPGASAAASSTRPTRSSPARSRARRSTARVPRW